MTKFNKYIIKHFDKLNILLYHFDKTCKMCCICKCRYKFKYFIISIIDFISAEYNTIKFYYHMILINHINYHRLLLIYDVYEKIIYNNNNRINGPHIEKLIYIDNKIDIPDLDKFINDICSYIHTNS